MVRRALVAVFLVAAAAGAFLVIVRASDEARPRSERAAQPGKPELSGKIAFARQSGAGSYHIHVINPDGTGEARLVSGWAEERTPEWSPDGTRIAFVRAPGPGRDAEGNRDVYVMNADGTAVIRVTDTPGREEDPAWSPDGARIVFSSVDTATGRSHISTKEIEGVEVLRVSHPPATCNDREPAWSPDGRRIAFVRRCGEEASSLYLMGADGTGVVMLAPLGRTPDWSPDGSKIAYTGPGSFGPAVFVINADGTGNRKLTRDLSGDPVWSPDGTRIAFTRSGLGGLDLYVINTDGSGVRRLTDSPSNDVTASW